MLTTRGSTFPARLKGLFLGPARSLRDPELFRKQFIQAGIVDAGRFKGAGALAELKQHLRRSLAGYISFVRSEGFPAGGFPVIGTDVVDEVCRVARGIFRRNPNSVFFGGQIVFPEETLFSRLLYNHTTFTVQRRRA